MHNILRSFQENQNYSTFLICDHFFIMINGFFEMFKREWIGRMQAIKAINKYLNRPLWRWHVLQEDHKDPQAIIDDSNCVNQFESFSRSGHIMTSHHHGWPKFQVSDRKLIEYTTERILWSIILPYGYSLQYMKFLSFAYKLFKWKSPQDLVYFKTKNVLMEKWLKIKRS